MIVELLISLWLRQYNGLNVSRGSIFRRLEYSSYISVRYFTLGGNISVVHCITALSLCTCGFVSVLVERFVY